VITRTICGTCAEELTPHTFSQGHKTIWDPNQQLAEVENNSSDPPNPQVVGWMPALPAPPTDNRDSETEIIGPAPAVPDYPPGYVDGLLVRLLAKKATRGQEGGAT
jgi:hypothetical protein